MTNKGFTIIESLVAISILVGAVIGATSAIQTGISSHILSKEQVTAFYLAQEGYEQVRNIRDHNRIHIEPWLTGLAGCFGSPCYPDVYQGLMVPCAVGCPRVKQDNATGLYGYDMAWSDTIYEREVELTAINPRETSVLVTVRWSKGILNREFKVKGNILDW